MYDVEGQSIRETKERERNMIVTVQLGFKQTF